MEGTSSIEPSTVALVVSKPSGAHISDPFYSQRFQVVLWVLSGKELTYYSYWDHPRQEFVHTDALLQRLAPLSVIHVADMTPKKGSVSTKLMLWLESRQADYKVGRLDDDAAVEDMVQCHSSWVIANSALERLPSVLQDMLPEKEYLKTSGNVELYNGSAVAKALVFFLQVHGWWEDISTELTALNIGVLESHLYLDRTAAQAIHLWPPLGSGGVGTTTQTGGASHNQSIAGVLGQPCMTAMAKRLLELWLRQPLVDLQALEGRQDAVEYWVRHSVARDAVRSEGLRPMKGQDLYKLAAKLSSWGDETKDGDSIGRTKDALKTLYELYIVSAQKLPLLLEQIENEPVDELPELIKEKVVAVLQQAVQSLSKSVELATAVLDLDSAPREFLVKSSYQPELDDIATELQNVKEERQACFDEMNDRWASITGASGAVRLEVENDTWQFRLPNTNDSKTLQQQLPHVHVNRVLKNGVYFSTKQLRQLATQHQDLMVEYNRYQAQIAADALQVASTYQPVLNQASDAVALLDVLCSLAHVAAYSPHGYCRPQLTDLDEGGGVELKGARHPCVELQEGTDFIPNDVNLVLDQSNFLIVTGPNMGGKSTYIRALGAIVTMAQIGAFVPCTSAKINICHHILARVGAGDLQERGISTFMAEMLEASSIMRIATKRSLIIIDELGRGTSTFDGYGLARAISEYLIDTVGCITVFATHFHELTALEETRSVVRNCHVTAHRASQGLTFLYQIKDGPCLESFGIQVAEMANVPAVVIEDAKRKAKELENFDYRPAKRSSPQSKERPTSEAIATMLDRFRTLSPRIVSPDRNMSSEEKRLAFASHLGLTM